MSAVSPTKEGAQDTGAQPVRLDAMKNANNTSNTRQTSDYAERDGEAHRTMTATVSRGWSMMMHFFFYKL